MLKQLFNKFIRKTPMLKNKDILSLNQALNTVGNLSGVRFSYAVAKNKKLIETEIEALNVALKASEKYTEFDTKRVELCKRLADKDEKGVAKMDNNSFVIIANKEEFDKELEALRTEYKEEIDAREAQIKKFNEMMEEESSFVPHKIKLADLPANITAKQTTDLFEIIEE